MNADSYHSAGPWLADSRPRPGAIARAVVRGDADRAAVEAFAPMDLLPAGTLYGCIKSAASLDPEKVAVVQLDAADPRQVAAQLTYSSLLEDIERAAVLFDEAACGERPVVSVICPLVTEALVAMWGAQTVGAANPINPFLEVDAVVSILSRLRSNVLVTASPSFGPAVWQRLNEIIAKTPTLRSVFVVGAGPDSPRDFGTALANVDRARFANLALQDGAADTSYMPTGGTTGAPKLVRHTQERQLLNAWLVGALNGSARDEVVGHGMPNFHVGGSVCIALRAIIFGQTLVTLTADGFRSVRVVRDFWTIMKTFGVSNIIATPATAAAILALPNVDHEGHRIHTFSCGGSTIPVELLHAFHEKFGLYLREVWGMTEYHGVLTGHPNDGRQPAVGSVGRALAFHRIRCVNLKEDAYLGDVPAGERGVLIARGPCVGDGYVDPSQSAALFVRDMPDGEVWASSGDIGSIDNGGHVWVFGREKDLIVRGGHKIDPRVIEDVLAQHPAVQLSAAVGRPDAARGELPMSYVQLKEGANAGAAELLEFCKVRISERAAVPVEIVLLPVIPMTAVGKIAKPVLRADAMRRVAHDTAASVAGEGRVLSVSIDETTVRPTVVVSVAASEGAVGQALRSAFLGFEFNSRFQYRVM